MNEKLNIPMADYHVHPDFSLDATGSMEDFCRVALERGLSEICFTTHYDSNPRGPEGERRMRIDGQPVPLTFDAVGRYFESAAAAREKFYADGLEVHCGIEIGYYPDCEEHIADLFDRFPFHYKLVAIHEVDDICVCCQSRFEKCFSRYSAEDMADRYFAQMERAVGSELFDAVAHIDVYKKYGLQFYGDGLLTVHRGRIEPVFKKMAETGVGFELNTSALRRGHKEYYPTMEIVNLGRRMGAAITAIGSDAHHPDEVAFDFLTAAGIAYELFPYCDE